MKKTIFASVLNLLLGGVGYLYIRELTRVPLAIFLTFATAYEFIRNILVISNPATANDPFAIHTLPMLSLFGSVPGIIVLVVMAVDIYFLVRRQDRKADSVKPRAKTGKLQGEAVK